MINDFTGKSVLITGGTMGIGLATGLAFGRQGAGCTLTYKWGSADPEEIYRAYEEAGAPRPYLVQADVASEEDTAALLQGMSEYTDGVDVLVSNVAVGLLTRSLDDYKLRSLVKSIEYSAWPVVSYTRALQQTFGRYPRYVVGLSSEGPDTFVVDYDFVAASKAVLETLCRYLGYRLRGQDVRVNVVRAGLVKTESLRATTGPAFEELVSRLHLEYVFTPVEHVAGAVLALCSGLMDGVSGQVIRVDSGTHFFNNLMGLYQQGGVFDETSAES